MGHSGKKDKVGLSSPFSFEFVPFPFVHPTLQTLVPRKGEQSTTAVREGDAWMCLEWAVCEHVPGRACARARWRQKRETPLEDEG